MQDDDSAIRNVVTDYLEGMIWGQPERLERAMHPRCMQAGHYKGAYEYLGRDEFIDSLRLEPQLPPGTPYRARILSIDRTADVAVVKVEDDCFGTSFTDYLTLIRHEERWQIVMKAFVDHGNGAD